MELLIGVIIFIAAFFIGAAVNERGHDIRFPECKERRERL